MPGLFFVVSVLEKLFVFGYSNFNTKFVRIISVFIFFKIDQHVNVEVIVKDTVTSR